MKEEERKQLREAGYIVWIDYGVEGWKPQPFNTHQEVSDFILGGAFGMPMVVTSGGHRLEMKRSI